MTNDEGSPTNRPTNKVVGATSGTVLGGAVAGVGIYIVETAAAIDIPGPVELSVVIIVSAILTFVGGYFIKNTTNAS